MMAEAPVRECDKFLYLRHTNHTLLLRQLHDGSGLDIFIAGEVVP
jgi:hypothetical protein